MTRMIPLTVVPLIIYNVVGYGLAGADPWANQVFSMPTLSGVHWSMNVGELLISLAIVFLFFELRRAARSSHTIANRLLSMIVLIVYVAEFIVAGAAAHSVFFILTLIALFDVAAGFSIETATAPRDIAVDSDIDGAI